ncbi:MAG TPA: hypothetical protein VN280_04700 [Variovorax sp.]|nr:hypothetical protein [Variovorax sp.]
MIARLALAALSFLAFAGAAHAQLMVYDPGLYMQVQMAAQSISQSISQSTSEQTDTLTENIDKNVSDLKKAVVNAISGAAETTSKASSGAARTIGESAQRTASEQATIRNEERFSGIDPCGVLVSTLGVSAALRRGVTATGGGGGGGAPRPAPGGSGDLDAVLDVAERRVPAPTPEVAVAKAAKAACASFATSGNVRGQACAEAGFSTAASTGFPNADLRASTLFDGPQAGADGAVVRRRLTVDLAGADGTAIRALMRNLDQPVQLKDLSTAQRSSDAGRQYLALEDAFQARMSVAKYPQEAQVNMVAAKTELIPLVQQLLKSDDSGFMGRYLAANVPEWESKGISISELVHIEVERRYMNGDYQLRVLGMSDSDLARENLRMQALRAWLSTLGLERQIHSAGARSVGAQAEVRAELVPQLIAANRRAINR